MLGLGLPLISKLLLAGTLVLIHLSRHRLRSVPAPLFRRREPVASRTRLSEGALGLGACYALCAAVYFFAFVGQPHGTSLTLTPVDGSPAQQAGLAPGDRARSVGGTPVKTFEDFREAVARGPKQVSIEVEREGRLVSLRITKDANNRIGAAPEPGEPLAALPALSQAVVAPAAALTSWLSMTLRSRSKAAEMAGPIAIGTEASAGTASLIRVLALVMTYDLLFVGFIYVVVLVTDTRSRARYQALRTTSALS